MKTPGLVDLQVNGFAGVDFNSGTITADDLDRALEAMLATGVTTCLPTIITAFPHELDVRFAALDRAVAESRLGPVMCPGYHLEGPFLNPSPGFAGCHPPEAMGPADASLVARLESRLTRPILMVTLAPEMAGGIEAVSGLARAGKIVAIGHSAADFEVVGTAADAGATLSTHLGNGLPQQMHKLANPLFAQLGEDRLMAGFIADGIHLDPRALKSLIRAKGLERSILVTDAVVAAGARPGRYSFAGMPVDLAADGSVRQPGGASLAGSALKLDDAVRNIVVWDIASFEQAVAMASTQALRAVAPALAVSGITLPESEIVWTADMRIARVRAGAVSRDYAA